ncbi:MAG: alpha/beta fold hydrolase [Tatlockia sp.]|nr:alpha/beta fold hydrolase [Tatlockia sp.]
MRTISTLNIKKISHFFLTLLIVLTLSSSNAATNDNLKSNNKLKWHPCKDSGNHHFLCGKISVPLDYKHPQSGKIELPVSMHPASHESRGYLLFNFGGPWADNVNILPSIMQKKLTPTMIEQFDLLVMNPRGVSPNLIECNTQNPAKLKAINEAMKNIFTQGDEHDAKTLYELAKQKQEICRYNEINNYAGTINTIQDIEVLRHALNIKKLNLYMTSYGTRLGLAYLVNYPEHVHRIILDGNIFPTNQLISLISPRAFGAVAIYIAFFQNCHEAGTGCILNKSSNNLIGEFNSLLTRARQNQGIPTNSEYANRPVTAGMIKNLMYTNMQPSNWKNLAQAIYEAEKSNSGNKLMKIYADNTGYDPKTGNYTVDNNETRRSVICGDYKLPDFSNETTWLKFINQINSRYSQTGSISTLWLTPICIKWNMQSTPLLPKPSEVLSKKANNPPQVLIIGNSIDPMTPFKNALAVKNYLEKFYIKSTIIKWNGVSHTALLTDSALSSCVLHNVDEFLIGKNVSTPIKCNDWQNPFTKNE